MSCWRKYTADVLKNIDKDFFKRACEEMGISINESMNKVSSSFERRSEFVDGVFVKDNKPLSLGFLYNGDKDGHLIVKGDFWGTGIDERTFISQLSQLYVKHAALYQLEFGQMMTIESCEQNEQGQIIIQAIGAA